MKNAPPAAGALVAPVAPTADIGDMSRGQMATKLLSYQQFRAMPSAPAKPTPAVSAPVDVPVPPEVAAADHGLRNDGGVGGPSLAQRINMGAQLLGGSATPVASAPMASASTPSWYDKRNARRWGTMEIQKARVRVRGEMATALPAATGAAAPASVSAEVEAADHGLRNDGGVGGPSLAQQISMGAHLRGGSAAPVASAPMASASTPSWYAKRNARRWGTMEIQKARVRVRGEMATALPAANEAAAPASVSAEVEAADHGLRNDGGVGGPSLADRVNLGASLLGQ
jgi:hypothetical protein